ncbi:acyl-coenzyme A thioesterase 13 [Arctopsyche grandis]|uniref:acyl-coenzyme A thioesterase 13 n=1 Tax=Arctopsyche grandis TaxID=121162 RepID=UPI00406D83CD
MTTTKGLNLLKVISEYIAKAKGHDRILEKLKLTSGGDGLCTAELKVSEEHLNGGGGLHGGYIASLVDSVSTYALMTNEKGNSSPGVSVEMHISYLKGARAGDDIVIDAKTVKAGKNLAFLQVEIKKKDTNEVLATGSHTKYVGSK